MSTDKIRRKVEARKAEIAAEQQRAAAERRARDEQALVFARQEAERRVALLKQGREVPTNLGTARISDFDEGQAQSETDRLLNAEARKFWTASERQSLYIILVAGGLLLFVNILIGLGTLAGGLIYRYKVTARHRQEMLLFWSAEDNQTESKTKSV